MMFNDWDKAECRIVGIDEFTVYWINPIRRFIESVKGRVSYILQEIR